MSPHVHNTHAHMFYTCAYTHACVTESGCDDDAFHIHFSSKATVSRLPVTSRCHGRPAAQKTARSGGLAAAEWATAGLGQPVPWAAGVPRNSSGGLAAAGWATAPMAVSPRLPHLRRRCVIPAHTSIPSPTSCAVARPPHHLPPAMPTSSLPSWEKFRRPPISQSCARASCLSGCL